MYILKQRGEKQKNHKILYIWFRKVVHLVFPIIKGIAFLNIAVSYYHLDYANTAAYWLDQYNVLYAHATTDVQAQLKQKEHICEDIIPSIKGDTTKTTFSIEDINIIKL